MVKWRNPLTSIRKRIVRMQSFPQLARRGPASYLLDPGNWIDNRVLAGVPYEVEQLARARSLIQSTGARVFIDIGANWGLYSIKIGMDRQVDQVIAFEPVRRNYNQLCANIFANRLDSMISPFRMALGSARSSAIIHVDPTSTGVSRVDLSAAQRSADAFTQTETIEIHRGDDELTFEGRVVFAKVDVEGAALDVFQGLEGFLARNSGALQVEISAEERGVREFLEARGWRAAGVIQADHYFEKPRVA
jgi:FkbM family methyltransferase